MPFEIAIQQSLHAWTGQSTLFDWFVVMCATILPYVLCMGAIFILIRHTKYAKERVWNFILGALSLILARGILTEVIRAIWVRPRPFAALGFEPLFPENVAAFPSGHAAFFFALACVVFFVDRKWGWWFIALAILNGFARVVAGVHWPTDILGGAIVGVGSFFIVRALLLPYFPKKDPETHVKDETGRMSPELIAEMGHTPEEKESK